MDNKPGGFMKRIWYFLKTPSAKYSVLAIAVVTLIATFILSNSFYAALEATNKLDFCVGCHEMRDNVYPEYQKTIHYSNRTGVRVTCPDCHVPRDFTGKMIRKVKAAKEIWGKLTGLVDTPEKFESHRMELATNVWERMKATDSRECRNCHNFDAMSAELQKQTPYLKHMKAKAGGGTCIDCHKGIAHHLPKEYRDPDEE
jgi:cytochrome c-type protein NapC